MARMTRNQAATEPNGHLNNNKILAILASATNPDGTPYTLPIAAPQPIAADVLAGRQVFTATTAATTLITIPAGRTWIGTIGASVACSVAAASATAGQATATITTAGTGVTPTAGTYLGVDALAGANAATGTAGTQAANHASTPLVVVAPAGNSVTIQAVATITGTAGRVDAHATGTLVAA